MEVGPSSWTIEKDHLSWSDFHGPWYKPALSATIGPLTLNTKKEEDVVYPFQFHRQQRVCISMYASQIETMSGENRYLV